MKNGAFPAVSNKIMDLKIAICLLVLMITRDIEPKAVKEKMTLMSILKELLNGPLRGDDVFIIDGSLNEKPDYWQENFNEETKIMIATPENTNLSRYDLSTLKSPLSTTVWILDSTSNSMDELIGAPVEWCPKYLIVVVLDNSVSKENVFNQTITFRTEFVVLFKLALNEPDTFELFVSFPFNDNEIIPMGYWNKENYHTKELLFMDRFTSLGGRQLKIGSFCDDYPFLYPNDADECIGASADLLQIVSKKVGFEFELQKEPVDQKWGAFEDGKWTGMLADLKYRGKDLVVNYFLLNRERWLNFDSTYPYKAEGFGFMSHLPRPLPKWNSLILPFAWDMWIAIIVCTVIVSTALAVLTNQFDSTITSNIAGVVLVTLGSLVSQPILTKNTLGKSAWRRVWFGVWWLGCIIFTTGYTGNLIAFLTVPLYPLRPETVKEIASSPKRVCMQDYGEFVPYALKASNDIDLRTIGNKLDLFPYGNHYDAGMEMVVTNQTHIIVETYSYLAGLRKEYDVVDKTYLLKAEIYSGHLSWMFPKHTPYTDRISEVVVRLREAGIVDKLFADHFNPGKVAKEDVEALAVSLDQLQGAFFVLLLGNFGGFIFLLAEILVSKAVKKQEENVEN